MDNNKNIPRTVKNYINSLGVESEIKDVLYLIFGIYVANVLTSLKPIIDSATENVTLTTIEYWMVKEATEMLNELV